MSAERFDWRGVGGTASRRAADVGVVETFATDTAEEKTLGVHFSKFVDTKRYLNSVNY